MFVLDAAASNGEVLGMGLGIVFFGLICLIVIVWLLGKIVQAIDKKHPEKAPEAQKTAPASAGTAAPSGQIPNRGEFVAAVSAAIAEDLGADVSKIQIISIKKL